MPALQLTKAWSINPNVRNAYASLTDMAGWWIYENHAWLITHGWTVKFTSDGTTADGNDNLLSKTDADTRGANAASPQSFTVLTNPDGVDLLIAYQGATDDIIRISYSVGGLYVLAGTPTHQPTATDEVLIISATSIVNATASADRVMSIWASDDGRGWSNVLFRAGVLQHALGLELVYSACDPAVFAKPYLAYRYNDLIRSQAAGVGVIGNPTGTVAGTAGYSGSHARIFTAGVARVTRLGAGGIQPTETVPGSSQSETVFLSNTPPLQAGSMPLIPPLLCGEKATNLDGFLGQPIDWWVGYSASVSVPAASDFFPGYEPADVPGVDPERSNWAVAIGTTMIRPWRNVAASLQTT